MPGWRVYFGLEHRRLLLAARRFCRVCRDRRARHSRLPRLRMRLREHWRRCRGDVRSASREHHDRHPGRGRRDVLHGLDATTEVGRAEADSSNLDGRTACNELSHGSTVPHERRERVRGAAIGLAHRACPARALMPCRESTERAPDLSGCQGRFVAIAESVCDVLSERGRADYDGHTAATTDDRLDRHCSAGGSDGQGHLDPHRSEHGRSEAVHNWDGKLAGCENDARHGVPRRRTRLRAANDIAHERRHGPQCDGRNQARGHVPSRPATRSSSRTPATADKSPTRTATRGRKGDDEIGEYPTSTTRPGCLRPAARRRRALRVVVRRSRPDVRIIVLSDSCHSGTVTR